MKNEKPLRILVVDDEESIRRVLSIALRRQDFDVSLAATGLEALECLAAAPVDVVLLDIDLPDICGVDVMRRALQTTRASIILMTGGHAGYSYATAIEDGAADYILKPVPLNELSHRIRRALPAPSVPA